MSDTSLTKGGLNQLYAELEAERERTWSPEDLAGNREQRRALLDGAAQRRFVAAGDRVADAEVIEVDAGVLSLKDLWRERPLLLVFFRFAGCPACNLALPYYAEALYPALAQAGINILALSPQIPERLIDIKRRHNLPFGVATDPANRLARHFDIAFEPDQATKAATLAKGKGYIGDVTGTGDWYLPMPAIVLIDTSGVVRFSRVSPDWLARTEAAEILEATALLAQEHAA